MAGREARPSFYDAVFANAEDEAEAAAAEGVDDEVALLRKKLRERVLAHPDDCATIARLMPLILRAIGMRYRISPSRAQDFAEHAAAVIKSITDQVNAPDDEL